jgi:Sec-independent protein translocase protein TatA
MKGLGSGIKEFKNAAKEESSSDKKDETEKKKKKVPSRFKMRRDFFLLYTDVPS